MWPLDRFIAYMYLFIHKQHQCYGLHVDDPVKALPLLHCRVSLQTASNLPYPIQSSLGTQLFATEATIKAIYLFDVSSFCLISILTSTKSIVSSICALNIVFHLLAWSQSLISFALNIYCIVLWSTLFWCLHFVYSYSMLFGIMALGVTLDKSMCQLNDWMNK